MPTGPDGCPLLGSGHPPAGRSPECAIFAGDSVQFQAGANTGIPSPLRYGWMRTYFERAVKALRFNASTGGLRYEGKIPAAESFRFLGLLSRYASLIDSFEFTAAPPPRQELH